MARPLHWIRVGLAWILLIGWSAMWVVIALVVVPFVIVWERR